MERRARHGTPRAGVQLSQQGGRVLAAYENGDAEVFDVATGRSVYEHILPRRPWDINFYYSCVPWEPYARASPARMFPNGRTVLLAGRRGSPFSPEGAWDGAPPSVVELEGDGGTVAFPETPQYADPCVLSPDHSLLVTGSRYGRLWLWDVATRRRLRSFEGKTVDRFIGYHDASMDRANRWLAAVGRYAGACVWNVRTGERRNLPHAWQQSGSSVRVSPDGRYLLLWVAGAPGAGDASPVRLWDLQADEEMDPPPVVGVVGATWSADPTELRLLTERQGRTSVVAWSPGGATTRAVITLPPSARGASRIAWYARPDGPHRIAVSYDGSTVAFTTNDGSIEVWQQAASNSPAPKHREP